MSVSLEKIQRLAGFELNALRAAMVLGDEFENVKVPKTGTPVYDINGLILFYRIPLKLSHGSFGYADIAASELLSEPLLAVSMGEKWDEKEITEDAVAAAHKSHQAVKFNSVRFVAYSFPKIAIQFLLKDKEVLMLEWRSWVEVPQKVSGHVKANEISNFERWSLIDEMPAADKTSRMSGFNERQSFWESPVMKQVDPIVVTKKTFDPSKVAIQLTDTREVHYSPRPKDHHPCYELRGQQTPVWCVAASVEMLMNFYRYQYDQPRLAQELGLGTCTRPNGLPYGNEYKVVDTIEKLSSKTLDATAISTPTWALYVAEIKANRPFISFIKGHSRTVIGYTQTKLTVLPSTVAFKGLLVYDPWPPTDCGHPDLGGTITRWENFNTSTYRFMFTAVLKHV